MESEQKIEAGFISIHAPRKAERPVRAGWVSRTMDYFNPRSAQGGATRLILSLFKYSRHFNPRSAQGGATRIESEAFFRYGIFQSTLRARRSDKATFFANYYPLIFQSTLRARRSDMLWRNVGFLCRISIHAPRKAERLRAILNLRLREHFNPRSAQGGATKFDAQQYDKLCISIHAPRKAERPFHYSIRFRCEKFQSTLRARRSDI